MPQRNPTAPEQDLHHLDNQVARARGLAATNRQHEHEARVADLMSAMEGLPMRAIPDLAGDFGLSEMEAFEAVEEMGDGFAPDPLEKHNANEASEDAPKH